jgi:uncharacterized ion transporter superfamily protein YfcC
LGVVGVLTQTVTPGEYDVVDGTIIDGTYHILEDYRLPVWKILFSPIMCLASSHAGTGLLIVVLIILIGGSFLILEKCGVLKYIMATLINKYSHKKYTLMAIVTFVLMALSSTAGVLEESLTLIPIAVAVSLALGWDSLVGLGMSIVSIAWGFTAATFNPFNVVTVQKLSGLDIFSGSWLRFIIFIGVYLVLFLFLYTYAKKIEKDPKKSLVYESDLELRKKYSLEDAQKVLGDEKVRKGTKAYLICMLIDVVFIILDFVLSTGGAISLPAMAILFTTGGLLAGHLTGLKPKEIAKTFVDGVKSISPAALLILFVIAISYVLSEGKIMHTILYHFSNMMQGISPYLAIFLILGIVALLEFVVGSSTAKAFLIIPLVAPLADLIGLTKQSVVTVFCLADGFTNLLYPTNGLMIIAIGLINVSYGKWVKWTWKLFLGEFIFSAIIMLLMVAINYQ